MPLQYNLQFTDGISGATFHGVMTVNTATNIITNLYELSDLTMKNLLVSTTNPHVSKTIYDVSYIDDWSSGHDPSDTNMYNVYLINDGSSIIGNFSNVFDISYGSGIFENAQCPFGAMGLAVTSFGSSFDDFYKRRLEEVIGNNTSLQNLVYMISPYQWHVGTFNGYSNTTGFDFVDQFFTITPFNVSCFTRNTKITTADGEVAIQNIRMGTLIPTLSSGLKEVVEIGVRNIKTFPDIEDVGLQIYRYEDGLRVTGKHSVLVDELTKEEQEIIPSIIGCLKQTEGKWLLPACIDPYAEQVEASGMFTVYHLVLENEDDDGNYGIVAHNTWVETCSKNDFDKYVK